MSDETTTQVDERSAELARALRETTNRRAFAMHTGGGVYVMCVELDNDRPGAGRQVWLTREDGWLLGFYDLDADDCDEGVCVRLALYEGQNDDVAAVAGAVAGILNRARALS